MGDVLGRDGLWTSLSRIIDPGDEGVEDTHACPRWRGKATKSPPPTTLRDVPLSGSRRILVSNGSTMPRPARARLTKGIVGNESAQERSRDGE